MIKKCVKSITALVLSTVMGVELMPVSVFAESEPVLLEYITPNEENDNTFSMATISNSVDEGGKYIITVVRNNAETKASVFLKTVDMSAKYGEDYIISDKNYETVAEKTNGTILEQSADLEEQDRKSVV